MSLVKYSTHEHTASEIANNSNEINTRIDTIQSDVAEINSNLTNIRTDVTQMGTRIDGIQTQINTSIDAIQTSIPNTVTTIANTLVNTACNTLESTLNGTIDVVKTTAEAAAQVAETATQTAAQAINSVAQITETVITTASTTAESVATNVTTTACNALAQTVNSSISMVESQIVPTATTIATNITTTACNTLESTLTGAIDVVKTTAETAKTVAEAAKALAEGHDTAVNNSVKRDEMHPIVTTSGAFMTWCVNPWNTLLNQSETIIDKSTIKTTDNAIEIETPANVFGDGQIDDSKVITTLEEVSVNVSAGVTKTGIKVGAKLVDSANNIIDSTITNTPVIGEAFKLLGFIYDESTNVISKIADMTTAPITIVSQLPQLTINAISSVVDCATGSVATLAATPVILGALGILCPTLLSLTSQIKELAETEFDKNKDNANKLGNDVDIHIPAVVESALKEEMKQTILSWIGTSMSCNCEFAEQIEAINDDIAEIKTSLAKKADVTSIAKIVNDDGSYVELVKSDLSDSIVTAINHEAPIAMTNELNSVIDPFDNILASNLVDTQLLGGGLDDIPVIGPIFTAKFWGADGGNVKFATTVTDEASEWFDKVRTTSNKFIHSMPGFDAIGGLFSMTYDTATGNWSELGNDVKTIVSSLTSMPVDSIGMVKAIFECGPEIVTATIEAISNIENVTPGWLKCAIVGGIGLATGTAPAVAALGVAYQLYKWANEENDSGQIADGSDIDNAISEIDTNLKSNQDVTNIASTAKDGSTYKSVVSNSLTHLNKKDTNLVKTLDGKINTMIDKKLKTLSCDWTKDKPKAMKLFSALVESCKTNKASIDTLSTEFKTWVKDPYPFVTNIQAINDDLVIEYSNGSTKTIPAAGGGDCSGCDHYDCQNYSPTTDPDDQICQGAYKVGGEWICPLGYENGQYEELEGRVDTLETRSYLSELSINQIYDNPITIKNNDGVITICGADETTMHVGKLGEQMIFGINYDNLKDNLSVIDDLDVSSDSNITISFAKRTYTEDSSLEAIELGDEPQRHTVNAKLGISLNDDIAIKNSLSANLLFGTTGSFSQITADSSYVSNIYAKDESNIKFNNNIDAYEYDISCKNIVAATNITANSITATNDIKCGKDLTCCNDLYAATIKSTTSDNKITLDAEEVNVINGNFSANNLTCSNLTAANAIISMNATVNGNVEATSMIIDSINAKTDKITVGADIEINAENTLTAATAEIVMLKTDFIQSIIDDDNAKIQFNDTIDLNGNDITNVNNADCAQLSCGGNIDCNGHLNVIGNITTSVGTIEAGTLIINGEKVIKKQISIPILDLVPSTNDYRITGYDTITVYVPEEQSGS